MKKYLNLLNAAASMVLLLTGSRVMAGGDPEIEKTKTFTKSYTIAAGDKISVNNQFGEVKINGWSKNEVKVDVTIIAKSATEASAQEILDRISIEDGKRSGGVYFKTNMKNDKKNNKDNKSHKEEKMEINYQVYMPVSNPLDLVNQFGATVIPDMSGQVDISSKFGNLTTGKLSNVKKVTVEFGSATVESINNGTLEVKFSKAVISKIGGSVDAVFEHSNGIKLGIENSMKELKIASAFSSLYLDVNKDFAATFEINTSFGDLSNKTGFDIKENSKQSKKPNFDHSYSGKSGNGSTALKISSSFSNVLLGHDLNMDIKEDKKDKKDKKTTTSI